MFTSREESHRMMIEDTGGHGEKLMDPATVGKLKSKALGGEDLLEHLLGGKGARDLCGGLIKNINPIHRAPLS